MGSGTAAPTVISIDYLAFKVDIEGKQSGIYRGVDKNVKVRISNSQTSGSIVTELDVPNYSNDMDFKVHNSTLSLNINGKLIEHGIS